MYLHSHFYSGADSIRGRRGRSEPALSGNARLFTDAQRVRLDV